MYNPLSFQQFPSSGVIFILVTADRSIEAGVWYHVTVSVGVASEAEVVLFVLLHFLYPPSHQPHVISAVLACIWVSHFEHSLMKLSQLFGRYVYYRKSFNSLDRLF
jgi:hypothetical protein